MYGALMLPQITTAATDEVVRAITILLSRRRNAQVAAGVLGLFALAVAGVVVASAFLEVPLISDAASSRALGLLLTAALLMIASALFFLPVHEWASERLASELRSEKVDKLATALKEAAALVAEIERDITVGMERVADLEADIENNQRLSELTAKEAEAVRNALQQSTSAERVFNVVLALVFFVLGVVASLIITFAVN